MFRLKMYRDDRHVMTVPLIGDMVEAGNLMLNYMHDSMYDRLELEWTRDTLEVDVELD